MKKALYLQRSLLRAPPLLNNFLNNSFLLNDLTVINNPEDNIYWNLAQLLKTGEKQLHLFIEDWLIMSKQPISAKIALHHFQFPGFKSPKKEASSVVKRLSPAFITKLRLAVTYRCEHDKLLFSSEIYDYCQSLSEDGSDLVSNPIFSIDSSKWQIEWKFIHHLLY